MEQIGGVRKIKISEIQMVTRNTNLCQTVSTFENRQFHRSRLMHSGSIILNYKILLLIAVTFFGLNANGQQGIVKGHVADANSNEPLPFVNVVVMGTSIGAITDLDGNFQIYGLNPGFIRLTASFVGYKSVVSDEVEVSNARISFLEVRMETTEQTIDEVKVVASPYRKTEESPVSLRSIGVGEIETNPGANRDISKVIQSFPGVTTTPAFRNDVIIRGGGPSEAVFYLDGIEVPNLNHFATQGSSGGAVGILNADFIREVRYYSGAFPANRGEALSGILEFNQVEGNSNKTRLRGTLGASELSATFDGPLGPKTTYIVSARRSYLNFLFSVLQLPFLPTFNDIQFKVKTRIDTRNELTFIGLGAIDQNVLNLDIENPDEQQQFIVNQLPASNQWTYTMGGIYKNFHDNGYLSIALSRNMLHNGSVKYFENDDSSPDNLTLDYRSREMENKLRIENNNRWTSWRLNYGTNLELVRYTNETFQKRFYQGQQVDINYSTDLVFWKYGLFGQLTRSFMADELVLSAGVRFDGNSYSGDMANLLQQTSPRISVSYQFFPGWSLNGNIGRYYQLPSYTTLGFRKNGLLVNRDNNLKYISSDHYILGLEHRPDSKIQFSFEGFYKAYSNYPYSLNDSISLANKGSDFGVVGDEEVSSEGEGRAYGFEVLARYNNQKNLNGNLSYTYVRSEFNDLRSGQIIPSSWDSRHLLTLFGTYKMERNWSVGAKWRFVGGLPYTPYDLEKSSLVVAWEAQGGPYPDYSRINSQRFRSFSQLDIRIDKAFYLRKFTAKFYIDIQNLYNYQAESADIIVREKDTLGKYLLSNDGTSYVLRAVKNTTGTVLPTIGVIIEL